MAETFSMENSLGVEIRLARDDPKDCRLFCDLSNGLYSRKVDSNYYRWQFHGTPHPSMLTFALMPEGDLGGCMGLHLNGCGREGGRAGVLLDIMVAPKYQGKGLFRRIAEFTVKQSEAYDPACLYTLCNRRAFGPVVHGLGWKLVNTFVDFCCPTVRAAGFSPQALEFQEVPDLRAIASDLTFLLRCHRERSSLLALNRTPDFLDWRFHKNERYRYRIFRCARAGRVFGYLALKQFADPSTGHRSGDIVDLLWAEDAPDLLAEMLHFSLHLFHSEGIGECTTWLQTKTMLDGVGRQVGFAATARERYLCVKAMRSDTAWMEDASLWFVTMVDSEVY